VKRLRKTAPERIWTEKRQTLLKELFAKGYPDKKIAEEINAADGSTYTANHIVQQRSIMGVMRSKRYTTRSSTRTKEKDAKIASRKKENLEHVVLKKSFKKNEVVYIPGAGICRYEGMGQVEAGSCAAGADLLTFVSVAEISSSGKTFRIPSTQLEAKKIRALLNENQLSEVEAILRSQSKTLPHWMQAKTIIKEKMLSSDFRQVAELARDLIGHRTKSGAETGLSIRQKAEEALSLLSQEYARVMRIPPEKAYGALEKIAMAPKRHTKEGALPEIA